MKLHVLPEAKEDARHVSRWYEEKRTGLGDEFLDVLESALKEIADAPLRFAKLESIETNREVRRKILPRFPDLVIFEIRAEDVIVLGVSHGRQHPEHWLPRLENG